MTAFRKNGVKNLRSNQCRKKDKLDAETAEQAAKELERREGYKARGYPCPKCGFHHVGHVFPRERIDRFRR